MDFPRYQYSRMSPDRSEQIVVRSDSWDDIAQGIEIARNTLPKSAAFPDDEGRMATPPEKVQQGVPVCPIHKNPMTLRNGKFGEFWSCGKKDNGVWCKYKPSEE